MLAKSYTLIIFKLLIDCVKQKFGKEAFEANAVEIRKGCNQKCLDRRSLFANMTVR